MYGGVIKLLILLSLVSFYSFAKPISLPFGGSLSLNNDAWDVHELKALKGLNSLILIHKKEKDLQGYILDGKIKLTSHCKTTQSSWKICENLVLLPNKKINHQIFIERKVSDSYQSYVLSLNYAEESKIKYESILKVLVKSMVVK